MFNFSCYGNQLHKVACKFDVSNYYNQGVYQTLTYYRQLFGIETSLSRMITNSNVPDKASALTSAVSNQSNEVQVAKTVTLSGTCMAGTSL